MKLPKFFLLIPNSLSQFFQSLGRQAANVGTWVLAKLCAIVYLRLLSLDPVTEAQILRLKLRIFRIKVRNLRLKGSNKLLNLQVALFDLRLKLRRYRRAFYH